MRYKVTVDTSHYPKDAPFEVPVGWEWTTIGDVFIHNTGKALNSADREGRLLPYITTSNLYWDRFELSTLKKMLFTEDELEKCTARKGDLLVCEGGDIGRAAIWNQDYEIRIQNHIHKLRGLGGVNHRLFMFWLMYMKEEGMIGGKGIGLMGLSSRELDKLLIPLPPLCEQSHLVDKIDGLFSVVSRIEKTETVLFETVSIAKSRILDLAIHGKLVPQDPSDEPAIELLKRINPDFKPSDNLHYNSMPRGWCECRLQDCVEILNGYAFKSNEYTGEGIRVIRITNVQSGTISDEDPKFFPAQRSREIDRYLLKEGDLLMSLTGNVGRVAFLEKSMLPAALNQRVACLRSPFPSEVLMFIFYFCQTKEFADACVSSGKGVAQLNISTEWLKDYRISLPPINEIRRILKAVRNHLILLDEIANL